MVGLTAGTGPPEPLPSFGVMLPSFDPCRQGTYPVVEAARLTEEVGFDSAWVGDHLAYHPPTIEPVAALSAAAAVTGHIRLGTAVMLLALRHPVWAAKQLASLDALAPGRVVLGVGAGGEGVEEFAAAGVPLDERGQRLDESLGVVLELLAGRAVDHPGPCVAVRTPALQPVPAVVPPVVVGGRSKAALRRAARIGAGWMGVWMTPERLASARAELARYAEEEGRDCPSVLFMVFVHLTEDEQRGWQEAAELADGQYRLPIERLARWIHVGPEDRITRELARYRDAGADGFVLLPVARNVPAQIEVLGGLGAELGLR